MESYLEICLLHLHIFSGCFFLKNFLWRKDLKPTVNTNSGFSQYVISYECALNKVFGNTSNNTIM